MRGATDFLSVDELGPTPSQIAAMLPNGAEIVAAHWPIDGEPAYELSFPHYWDRVEFLDRLADHDARDPRVRRWAEIITLPALGHTSTAADLLHRAVRDAVVFAHEPTETFQHTLRTLATMRGDCDDVTRALAALGRSIGIPCRLATLADPPTHVWPQFRHDGRWWHAETTVAAHYGEHPLAAVARLKIADRKDVAP